VAFGCTTCLFSPVLLVLGFIALIIFKQISTLFPAASFLAILFVGWLLFISIVWGVYRRMEDADQQKEANAQLAVLREQHRAKLLATRQIDKLNPKEFEEYVAAVFQQMGYRTQQSGHTYQRDGGIDIRAWRGNEYVVIQCKKVSSPVSESIVRDLLGVVTKEKAHKGILASTGGYSSHAKQFAHGAPLELWEAGDLVTRAKS
jgi:predicted Mrr-cat superfamily restriction endonuclease